MAAPSHLLVVGTSAGHPAGRRRELLLSGNAGGGGSAITSPGV